MNADNKRNHFRVNLKIPLKGTLKIISINNLKVNSNYANVFIVDLSAGGAKIHTKLNLPSSDSLLLEFKFTICSVEYKLLGNIVRKKINLQNMVIEYGIYFILDENKEKALLYQLNLFCVQLKNKNRLSNCSFTSDEEIIKFYKKNG